MNKITKIAFVAAAAAVVTSSAQAYNYGDVYAGFSVKSGNDYIIDLGPQANLVSGETWDIGSTYSSALSSSVNWGVIGVSSPTTANAFIWSTTASTALVPPSAGSGKYSSVKTGATSIGTGLIPATQANSWATETINGTLSTEYYKNYGNPNVAGFTSDVAWSTLDNSTTPVEYGTYNLSANGILTYNGLAAVPEPTTYGLIAGAGLLLVSLRNKFARSNA